MKDICISHLAEQEFAEILARLRQQSDRSAQRWADKLWNALNQLGEGPFIGSECDHLLPGLRYWAVGHYVIYYMPTENGIEVYHIVAGSRDLSRIFGKRAEE